MTTQADIDAKNRRVARRFFWVLLILATGTSVYGNIAHSISGSAGVSLNGVVCASIAPIFLMALVHGVAHLARNTSSGWAYGLVVALVGAVAAFAFAQSYGALTAFARDANVLAPALTPLIVDATIAVSTFALVVLGDKPTRRSSSARSAGTTSASPVRRGVSAATATPAASRTATRKRDVASQPTVSAAPLCDASATHGDVQRRDSDQVDATDEAVALVQSRVTRQPVEVVRAILQAHNEDVALNRIAKDVGVHHSAVKRIVDEAARRQQQVLAGVG
jgi:hypothetical protein